MKTVSGAAAHTLPYGLMSAAQMFAMKVNRFMHDHGVAAGGAAGHLAGVLRPRPAQPAGRDARPPARRGDLRRVALDRRAVPPVRLLPGERRRRRHGARRRRAGQGLPAPAVLRAGRGVRLAAPRRRAGAQHARVRVVELHHRRAPALRHGRARAERRRRAAELRELHRRRADEHRRARLLQAGRGQRVPHRRQPAGARAASCRSTPAAATWPSATCTASGSTSRRSARSAASPPRRCPTPTSRWWRRARW